MTPAQRKVIQKEICEVEAYLIGYTEAQRNSSRPATFDTEIAKLRAELAELQEGI